MRRFGSRPTLGAAALLIALGGLVACEPAPDPTSFGVVDTGDLGDAHPGDGICEATEGQGDCTFRAAIEEGNATGGPILIEFSDSLVQPLTGPVVVGEPAPVITTSTTIDGNGVLIEGRLVHTHGALVLRMFGIARASDAPASPGCDATIQSTGTRVGLEYSMVEAWPPTTDTRSAICADGDVVLVSSEVGSDDPADDGPVIDAGGNLLALNSAVFAGRDGIGAVVGGDAVQVISSYVEHLDPGTASGQLRLADVAGPLTSAITASGSILRCRDGGTVTSAGHNADRAGACGATAVGDVATDDDLGALLGHWNGLARSWMPAIGSPVVDAIPAGTPGLCDEDAETLAMNGRRWADQPCDIGPIEVRSTVEITSRQVLTGTDTGLCGLHVNDAGTVAGTGGPIQHQFATVWRADGTQVPIGDVDEASDDTLGCGLGEDGTVVGTRTDDTGRHHALTWHEVGGDWQETSVGPDGRGIARDINAAGTIVGDDPTETGVWWQPADGVAQPAPDGVRAVSALNDAGIAAGFGDTADGTGPVRWNVATGAVDLLPAPSGVDRAVEDPNVPDSVRDVSPYGTIVGSLGTRPVAWYASGAAAVPVPFGFHGTATAIDLDGNMLLVREGDTPAERGTYLRTLTGEVRLLSRDLTGFDLNDHGVVVGIEPGTGAGNLVQAVRLQLAFGD